MSNDHPPRILFVGDDAEAGDRLRSRLSEGAVEVAVDVDDALARFEQAIYDVLVLDEGPLRRLGVALVDRLVNAGRVTSVIALVHPGNEPVAAEALRHGASDHAVVDAAGGSLDLLPALVESSLRRGHQVAERERAAEQRRRDLAFLHDTGVAISATEDLQQLASLLLAAATRLVDAEGGSIWLWDEDEPEVLVCRLVKSDHRSGLQDMRLPRGEGIAGWVARTASPAVSNEVTKDERFFTAVDAKTGFETRSVLAVPLSTRRTVLGVLELVNKRSGGFDGTDLALVETLAAPAALAVGNARAVLALERGNAELRARNAALDAFAHTVAHDLKSPLISLVGLSDALIDAEDPLPPDDAQHYLGRLSVLSRRLYTIVEEMLLLASVRGEDVEARPLDMATIVGNAYERVEDEVIARRAVCVIPPEWPTAYGHAQWVEEVWVNYLSNALKYGGDPPRIELGAAMLPDRRVRFWVRDNGEGLSPEEQGQLFQPFTRLGRLAGTGHGLGLSIVQRIVDRLGGRVGVLSEPGQGSVFSFALPSEAE